MELVSGRISQAPKTLDSDDCAVLTAEATLLIEAKGFVLNALLALTHRKPFLPWIVSSVLVGDTEFW